MFKKLVFILAVLGLVAFAGTVSGGGHYRITLYEPAAVAGTVLPAGIYKLDLKDAKLTIVGENSKTPV
ncbi:MAG TPA: hypothetical protein VML19_17790, partial [Verrucomicrobiae bacterium]|nr:hypothetical protein [Verrucomicrobiae bacterium]